MTKLLIGACALMACCVRPTPLTPDDLHQKPAPLEVERPPQAKTVAHAVKEARGDGRGPYQVPTTEVMTVFAAEFEASLQDPSARLPMGVTVQSVESAPDLRIFALPKGHGVVVFRTQSARPYIIEVPHSFADLDTLPLGLSLFRTLKATALIVNGTQRRVGCSDGQEPCPADVAHAPSSYFHGAHLALTHAMPQLVPIAVHGFEVDSERDPLLILSAAGTNTETQRIADALTAVLRPLADVPVKRFPEEIDRLGGTTCVQAQAQREASGRMLHLEFSRSLRESLRKDSALARQVGLALLLVEAPP